MIRNTLILLALFFSSKIARSQDMISYSYDNNGNRTTRIYTPVGLLNGAISEDVDNKDDNKEQNDILLSKDILLHPNPTDGIIQIYITKDMEAPVTFYVYDMNGKLVKQAKYEGFQKEIDLSGQVNGTYFLKVKVGDQVVSSKIIKK